MRKMMLREQDLIFFNAQLTLESTGDPEFIQHPTDHRLPKDLPRLGISLKHSRKNTIQFAERLFEEDDVVEVRTSCPAGFEAILDCVLRKAVVVLRYPEYPQFTASWPTACSLLRQNVPAIR